MHSLHLNIERVQCTNRRSAHRRTAHTNANMLDKPRRWCWPACNTHYICLLTDHFARALFLPLSLSIVRCLSLFLFLYLYRMMANVLLMPADFLFAYLKMFHCDIIILGCCSRLVFTIDIIWFVSSKVLLVLLFSLFFCVCVCAVLSNFVALCVETRRRKVPCRSQSAEVMIIIIIMMVNNRFAIWGPANDVGRRKIACQSSNWHHCNFNNKNWIWNSAGMCYFFVAVKQFHCSSCTEYRCFCIQCAVQKDECRSGGRTPCKWNYKETTQLEWEFVWAYWNGRSDVQFIPPSKRGPKNHSFCHSNGLEISMIGKSICLLACQTIYNR